MLPRLIIHGGAGKRPSIKRQREIQKALDEVLKGTYPVLLEKGAVEAVVRAVTILEDNPLFNAGTGSRLQSDGRARLTASLMDGGRQRSLIGIRASGPITQLLRKAWQNGKNAVRARRQ